MIFASKHGLFWDWVQWKLTGSSPSTRSHSGEIYEILERLRRDRIV